MTKEKIHLRRCLGALRLEVDGSIVEHLTAAIDAMVASVRHENEDLRRTLGPTAIQALLEGKAAVVPSPTALPDSAILATFVATDNNDRGQDPLNAGAWTDGSS